MPTFRELGHPDLTSGSWFALSGPPNLPAEIVARLNREVRAILRDTEVRQRLEEDGFELRDMAPEAVEAFFTSERERWGPVAKAFAKPAAK